MFPCALTVALPIAIEARTLDESEPHEPCTNGVLFLDELPESERSTLEVLRHLPEDRKVTVSPGGWHGDFSRQPNVGRRNEPVRVGIYMGATGA